MVACVWASQPLSSQARARGLVEPERGDRLAGNEEAVDLRRVWVWALVAGGLALAAVMGIALMTYRFATLPDAAYQAPFEVASFPPWTLVLVFAAVALTAAVVEEAAFRGYMLTGIQRRFGWAVGISLVAILFYVAHLSHAYATLAFFPFGWMRSSTRLNHDVTAILSKARRDSPAGSIRA